MRFSKYVRAGYLMDARRIRKCRTRGEARTISTSSMEGGPCGPSGSAGASVTEALSPKFRQKTTSGIPDARKPLRSRPLRRVISRPSAAYGGFDVVTFVFRPLGSRKLSRRRGVHPGDKRR
jgi:hypothetical protein